MVDKSMLIVSSVHPSGKTFSMIPINKDCPYLQVVYDPGLKVLGIVSKDKKDVLRLVDKLNEDGVPIPVRANSKEFKKERKTLEEWYEYYVRDEKEIVLFVNMFGINTDLFDFKQYMIQK